MQTLARLAVAAALVIGTSLAAASAATATDYTIVLDKMKFGAVPAELHSGDVVIWQNNDIFRHSATARDKSFDLDLPSKAEVKMIVGAAGSVDFFCKFHPRHEGHARHHAVSGGAGDDPAPLQASGIHTTIEPLPRLAQR